MSCRSLPAILVCLSLVTGCGKSPSAPASSSAAAQATVISTTTQAIGQVAILVPGGIMPNPFTQPCPNGGSIVVTWDLSPQAGVYRSSSRMEFRDCTNQTTIINGDPYLETSSELSGPALGTTGDSVSTVRTTGGLRMDAAGVQGRVRFDCTMTMSFHSINGAPQMSMTSAGTITFEQPIGSTPVARPCGPA